MFKESSKIIQSYSYLKTGIFEIDRYKGGIRDSDFVIVSAASGIGKSLLSLWMAANVALNGFKVCYMSFENGLSLEIERLTSFGKQFLTLYENKNLLFFEHEEVEHKHLKNKILNKDQNLNQIILQKLETIENMILLHNCKLLVIDLFSSLFQSISFGQNIPQLTNFFAYGLQKLAIKRKCAIIAIEQLKNDSMTYIRPNLNQVSGGASITRSATKVFMLYKHAKANPEKIIKNPPEFEINNYLELIVAKDRTGDITEKTYLLKVDHGFKQLMTYEFDQYINYVFGNNK